MLALIMLAAITLVGWNGDDYKRPDIRERRLERQDDRKWQEEKWLRQQEQHRQWLNDIAPPRN